MNSNELKNFTKKVGADLCGIAPIERFRSAPKGFSPIDVYPQTKSVIAFAKRIPKTSLYLPTSIPYTVIEYGSLSESHRIAYDLMLYIESKGYEGTIVPSEPYEYWDDENKTGKGLVSLKHIGHKCGLGIFGKNHLLYNPQFGSLIRLGAVLTNATLEPDNILKGDICQSRCSLCMDSCPVGAITAQGVDQAKCRTNSVRKTKKGDTIYDCTICRRVCVNVAGIKAETI